MATQFCPSCGDQNFTWTVDEEETPLTRWGCATCSYMAFEDEDLTRNCPYCEQKSERLLDDDEKQYWWCCQCNYITPVMPRRINEEQV